MTGDYFYGNQAEQFSFYRIPKALFTDPRYKSISAEAKVLYGILLDRMSLSRKNGWMDEKNRVYIIFTVDEIMDAVGCAAQKAIKLLSELENKCGLIERKRQGLGKPNLLYVKNFISSDSYVQNFENHNSAILKTENQDFPESQGNNTYQNNTDPIYTDRLPFCSEADNPKKQDRMGTELNERNFYRETVKKNISYDILLREYPCDNDILEEIVELMTDTICTRRRMIRIAGDDKPSETVKSVFLKINCEHIRMVMDNLKKNSTEVKNIRQYILASIYNSCLTISSHYQAMVNYDLNRA